ncbi:MAG: DUF937 domain-containing protein [Candidatus Eisenbacteria bacterium]|nr:DUF937 domain-containing protein [Candidatus Eisenbacteria bacterium]
MPGVLDLLGATLGGDLQRQLGQQLGAGPQATGNAIEAALPMLLSGLARNVAQPGGADALHQALQNDHDGSLLDNLGELLGGTLGGRAANGAGILGHVLGDRQDAAQRAVAQSSGLDGAQAAQLLATLAPIVMGVLGRTQHSQGLNSAGLASMLQNEHATATQSRPDLMGVATQLLDRNHDGSMLDDLMNGLGGMLGRR